MMTYDVSFIISVCNLIYIYRQILLASVTIVSFGLLRSPSSRLVQEALSSQQFKVCKWKMWIKGQPRFS